jgi:hypothetical protein
MPSSTIDARARAIALQSLVLNPGWQLFCERIAEVRAIEIDAKIFDLSTPAEERDALLRARKMFEEKFAPEKLRQAMLSVAENEIRTADRK